MPMAWFAVLPITSAVRFLALPIPLVKGLKVPVSTGSCVLGRMRASVGSWLSSVLLVSLGGSLWLPVSRLRKRGQRTQRLELLALAKYISTRDTTSAPCAGSLARRTPCAAAGPGV